MARRATRPEREPDDDDPGQTGAQVGDPILRWVRPGPSTEPSPEQLLKGSYPPAVGADTGAPPAGRMTIEEARRRGPLGWLQLLGPGLITGASDDDPSGIGTYSQVGSQFGYGFLWTALFTFPVMAAVQEVCARIALHTGVGLGVALRRKFPTPLVGVCIAALFVANTINAGADLGAIAAGGSLLTHDVVHQLWLVVPAALLILVLQVFMSYQLIFKIFKWLTVGLFAYVVTGVLVHPDLRQVVAASLIPHLDFSPDSISALVAIFGTTISPYLFFWQASSEVDEMRAAGKVTEASRRGVKTSELKAARADILLGMLFSNLVMYFIMLTTGAVLHAHGHTNIESAGQAAQALAPLAGQWAFVLFAAGMIGTGLLAVPILTGSAAYAVKEFVGFKGALADKPWYRPTFYGIMAASTVAAVALNLIGINPIRALFVTAMINGVVAPPLMVLIVLLGSDRSIMKARTSGWVSRSLCWLGTGIMSIAAVALLVTLLWH